MDDKKGSFHLIFLVLIISLVIASFWNSVPIIKDSVHSLLNPTAGKLIMWNVTWGMTILVLIISLFMTLAQKYATDQKALKEIKAEQKELQKQMKEFKDDPAKVMELNKKSLGFMPIMMKHSMRPIIYTGIPLILLFRWFGDFFLTIGSPSFFGFFNWFWYYLVLTMVFSGFLRKMLNVH